MRQDPHHHRSGIALCAVLAISIGVGTSCSDDSSSSARRYPDQCADRVELWQALWQRWYGTTPDGGVVEPGLLPDDCPDGRDIKSPEFQAFGFAGWEVVDGPQHDVATDRCCYTTAPLPDE